MEAVDEEKGQGNVGQESGRNGPVEKNHVPAGVGAGCWLGANWTGGGVVAVEQPADSSARARARSDKRRMS
jgi:hypothetical protein